METEHKAVVFYYEKGKNIRMLQGEDQNGVQSENNIEL